jgi:hypothetical protein
VRPAAPLCAGSAHPSPVGAPRMLAMFRKRTPSVHDDLGEYRVYGVFILCAILTTRCALVSKLLPVGSLDGGMCK